MNSQSAHFILYSVQQQDLNKLMTYFILHIYYTLPGLIGVRNTEFC